MEEFQSVKYRYLDASALVKLILLDCPDEEPEGEDLRNYFNNKPKPFYTTPTCFAETIGVIDKKFSQNIITSEQRKEAYEKLIIMVWGNSVKLDDVKPECADIFDVAKRIFETYKLGFSDTMQIVTILHGRFSDFCAGSQSILITADKKLANAARTEGADARYCIEEELPD